jgi:hypothetical protein
VTSKVFGSSTDWDGGFEDLETGLGPFSNGFKLDSTGDEGLGEITTTSSESVGTDSDGSGGFVSFEES